VEKRHGVSTKSQVDIKRQRTRERRDFLNVAWQILKEHEGEQRLISDEGAYLNYPKSSTNDKADHLPITQFIFHEVTEGKVIDPTVRIYIDKGLWNSEFELKFRQHYEREEAEQQKREEERRVGREVAPGSSTDYTVPHSMMRDRERVRTWKMILHKNDIIEQHRPKFWEDVQEATTVIQQGARDGRTKKATRDERRARTTKGRVSTKGNTKGDTKGRTQAQAKERTRTTSTPTPRTFRDHRTPS
jgi:hypothetical protein